jgi:Tol biopolymer transport system component
MMFDGSDLRRLTSSLVDERCPSISPDGNWIAYYVFVSGGTGAQLWLMRANGKEQHRIASIPQPGQCPVWSRSNDLVEVTTPAASDVLEPNSTVQVFDLAGNEVAHHEETSFGLFEFSADAQEFLVSFQTCALNGCMDPDLAVITRDGSFERLLTSGVRNGVFVHEGAKEASISPDGLTVVYVCKPDSDHDPYSYFPIRAACTRPWDGTPSRFLLTDLNSPQWPKFSPDGKRIAFICSQGAQSGICLIAPDGSNLTMVPTPPVDGAPSWTADGTRVIFTCQVGDICALDIRTSSFANLTNGAGANANPSVSRTN